MFKVGDRIRLRTLDELPVTSKKLFTTTWYQNYIGKEGVIEEIIEDRACGQIFKIERWQIRVVSNWITTVSREIELNFDD